MPDWQGIVMNLKKLRRLYREEKLVRKCGGRKRALVTRRPLALPSRPNERWSLDFVSDAFMDGRCRPLYPRMPGDGRRHVALRSAASPGTHAVIARRGKSRTIVSDKGTETSLAVLERAKVARSSGITSRRASRSERLRGKLQWQLP